VEAAGIEPASVNPRPKASTCLDLVFKFNRLSSNKTGKQSASLKVNS
jgi:hypothetical protein